MKQPLPKSLIFINKQNEKFVRSRLNSTSTSPANHHHPASGQPRNLVQRFATWGFVRQPLENDIKTLAHPAEVYRSLGWQLNIDPLKRYSSVARMKRALKKAERGYRRGGWGWIIVSIIVLIFYCIAYFDAVTQRGLGDHKTNLVLGIVTVTFSAWIIILGYLNLLRAALVKGHCTYADTLYQILIRDGVILKGNITRLERVGSSNVFIHYHFQSPTGRFLKGQYLTIFQRRYQEGSEVVVLYADYHLHILL